MRTTEMRKRRKEDGFTLIELMIVIAVIGILAIVLIPKVGVVKTQAKTAGIDTNMRAVEGYVQSNINNWVNSDSTSQDVADYIASAFSGTEDNELPNPFTNKTVAAGEGTYSNTTFVNSNPAVYVVSDGSGKDAISTANLSGTIVVSPESTGVVSDVKIIAHDVSGNAIDYKTITIKP